MSVHGRYKRKTVIHHIIIKTPRLYDSMMFCLFVWTFLHANLKNSLTDLNAVFIFIANCGLLHLTFVLVSFQSAYKYKSYVSLVNNHDKRPLRGRCRRQKLVKVAYQKLIKGNGIASVFMRAMTLLWNFDVTNKHLIRW